MVLVRLSGTFWRFSMGFLGFSMCFVRFCEVFPGFLAFSMGLEVELPDSSVRRSCFVWFFLRQAFWTDWLMVHGCQSSRLLQ